MPVVDDMVCRTGWVLQIAGFAVLVAGGECSAVMVGDVEHSVATVSCIALGDVVAAVAASVRLCFVPPVQAYQALSGGRHAPRVSAALWSWYTRQPPSSMSFVDCSAVGEAHPCALTSLSSTFERNRPTPISVEIDPEMRRGLHCAHVSLIDCLL